MHIFINDTFVHLLKPEEEPEAEKFNFIIEAGKDKITRAQLIHHVLLKGAKEEDFAELLTKLEPPIVRNLLSITVIAHPDSDLKKYFKSQFKVIKAAGGVVRKGNKILMINRLKKWDLPKGKIEKREDVASAALREVEEETGVKAKLKNKLCNTWHTYTIKKKAILKKTTWYEMKAQDDSQMSPQSEEDIEDLAWMTPKEVFHAVENSYRSIQYVVDLYYKSQKAKA